jgi:16S rRNA (guanine527-N7)-methyltransferase
MTMHVREAIDNTLRKNPLLDSCVSAEQIDKLVLYWELVQRWGRSLNLSRRKNVEDWARADVADCFLGLHATGLFADKSENHVRQAMDIGSGAGFPGVPLALLCERFESSPRIDIRWIETLQKRVSFLHRVSRELKLPQMEACHMRIENVSEPADWMTIRATFP